MGGALTFVGSIVDRDLVAVAMENSCESINAYPFDSDSFDLPIKGKVFLVKTDADGDPVDVGDDDLVWMTSKVARD